MARLIDRQVAIEAIKEIRDKIWDVDIPSPTVPEYIEHHQQMIHLMNECDNKLHELYLLPSAQPEIIRCKECLWRIGRDCTRFTDLPVYMDDYCGRAKRRGEQDETD